MTNSPPADQPSSVGPADRRDPYRTVVLALVAATAVGGAAALFGGSAFENTVLLQVGVGLFVWTGILTGVAMDRSAEGMTTPRTANSLAPPAESSGGLERPDEPDLVPAPEATQDVEPGDVQRRRPGRALVRTITGQARRWSENVEQLVTVRLITACAGATALILVQGRGQGATDLTASVAAIGALVCLAGAGLAATAVRYLADIDPAVLPDAVPLARGARVVGWMLVIAAASIGVQWAGQQAWLSLLSLALAGVNAFVCVGLLIGRASHDPAARVSADFGVTRVLGRRASVVGSILDAAQEQLGIDLRSTWALTVVRRSVEPLAIGLAFVGWLSTGLTVIGVEQLGLVERLGVPRQGAPLGPGLHAHMPWPIDRVFRIPVQRVQSLSVGHEGQEEAGPEDVLWARVHAANEYTLLLGNGRDLITVDAAVQFRIVDPKAWHYRSQNPADALRAIAYRAVMRTTVNKTLADALSENLVATTARMRTMVQEDANALGLGVEVLGFTVGGMHPPVMVAADYQSVVSAALGRVTAVVNAQAFRNRTVPYAESERLMGTNNARAEGAGAVATATGDAWSFLALQAQYGASPGDYVFRRRLETLEAVLALRRFTVIDVRVERAGGELWITP